MRAHISEHHHLFSNIYNLYLYAILLRCSLCVSSPACPTTESLSSSSHPNQIDRKCMKNSTEKRRFTPLIWLWVSCESAWNVNMGRHRRQANTLQQQQSNFEKISMCITSENVKWASEEAQQQQQRAGIFAAIKVDKSGEDDNRRSSRRQGKRPRGESSGEHKSMLLWLQHTRCDI